MKKIKVAILLFLTVLFLPVGALGAQIGVILTGDTPYYQEMQRAFAEELKAQGIRAEIVIQTPSPDPIAWANAARKMEAIGVDIIVVYGAPATLAVMKETSRTPVVFAGVSDYQALGIGGKNITGISSKVQPAGILKNLKAIKDFSTLGVIYNTTEKDTVIQVNEIEKLGAQFGFKTVKVDFKSRETGGIRSVEAIYLTTSCSAQQCLSKIVGAAHSLKVPTAISVSGGENMGIILSISADAEEQGSMAAVMVGKILKGASPSSIRVEMPRKIELVVNLREANEMGLKIPLDVLTSATRVVR